MITIANFIDGEDRAPVGGQYLDGIEPATGSVYSRVPDSDERDVEAAIQAAKRAFPGWSKTPAAERSRILLAIANGIESRREELARAESVDNGKPISVARTVDIPRAASNFRFFATAILHAASESHQTDDQALNFTLRPPRGVAGLISPWNLPLYLFTWKVAPALAAGCTAVGKPSEVTPMTAYLLGEICQEAGLPPGVLNIVHGLGPKVGPPLTGHPDVPVISFTGGTATGAAIARHAAPLFKKLSLELGGKNPNLVFADADLDEALDTTVRSSFANQGQICLCGSRILVQASIVDRFTEQLVERANALTIGDPLDDATQFGAIVSNDQHEKVASAVERARSDGGTIHCGGEAPSELPERVAGGYYYRPTVISGLPASADVNQNEIFGPVVSIQPFETEEEAVQLANGTAYGLSASVWTQDISRAHRLGHHLDAGTVWINTWMLRDLRVPFGGTKQSGVGREGGLESLHFFTEPKNICIRIPGL